jgi:hypothetical protein
LRLSELATDSKDTTALEALLVQAEALLVEAGELQAAGSLREAISKVKDAYAFFRQVALGAQQL